MTVYKKKFAESKTREYYVTTDYKFYSVSKRTKVYKEIKPFYRKDINCVLVRANHIPQRCKNIVAKAFIKGTKDYDTVEQINGDVFDFSIGNLRVIHVRENYGN